MARISNTERHELMARLKVLELETIARQRESILWLEGQLKVAGIMRRRIERILGGEPTTEGWDALVEVLKGWPSNSPVTPGSPK